MRCKRHTQRGRRGGSLIALIGSLFVTMLVLGTCVPLFLAAQQQAHGAAERAEMRDLARELTSRFRQDVRGASQVSIEEAGTALKLRLTGNTPRAERTVHYRWSPEGLTREVFTTVNRRATEQMRYARPLAAVRFSRGGTAVTALFRFTTPSKKAGFTLTATATPRREP